MNEPSRSATSRANPVGRVAVAVSVFCSTMFPPFFWFNDDHAGSSAWPAHARFHLTWNACLVMGLGLLALAALVAWWEREPKVRLAVTAVPLVLMVSYFVAAWVVVPAVIGVPDALHEHTPLPVIGYAHHQGWYGLFALTIVGYWLDHRARQRRPSTDAA